MAVFKAYDIRGRYPNEISEDLAERIGYWTAKFLGARSLAIGRDVRMAAPSIAEAASRGARAAGAIVYNLGLVTTPMSYFAVGRLKLDGGIMVTASHNPPPDIGFKICRAEAFPIGERTGLKDIEGMVAKPVPPAARPAEERPVTLVPDYRAHLRRFVGTLRPMTVAVDTASGCVGAHFDALFGDLPVRFERLCFPPDGRFPNHEPNPLKDENVRDLVDRIRSSGADFGVGFDGDGDRCLFFDSTGRRIPSDLVTVLLARQDLARHPGAAIVYDLRSSRVVREEIEKAGGRAIRERVGHAFIKETMRKNDAVLGGELSGHFYFKEHFFADSGLLAFARFLDLVGGQPLGIDRLLDPFRRYHATGEVNFRVEDKQAAMRAASEAFPGGQVDWLDGVTVEFPDWWVNLRPSNTEPLLRMNLEARDAAMLVERRGRVEELLRKFGAVAEH